jgi:hypothetical protein
MSTVVRRSPVVVLLVALAAVWVSPDVAQAGNKKKGRAAAGSRESSAAADSAGQTGESGGESAIDGERASTGVSAADGAAGTSTTSREAGTASPGEGATGDDTEGVDTEGETSDGSLDAAGAIESDVSGGSGMKGRIGLGAMRTLSGLNAISTNFYVLDKLSLNVAVGFATFTHKDVDENGDFGITRTFGYVGAGAGVFYWPYQGDRSNQVFADVGIGGRGVFYKGFRGGLDPDNDDRKLDDPMEIDLEIPMQVQLWIGDQVSFTPELGVAVRFVPGSREPDENGDTDENPGTGAAGRLGTTNGPGIGVELGSHAGLFFGLGIHYYFGGAGGKGKARKSKKQRAR